MKRIYWNRKNLYLGVVGTKTYLKDSNGKSLMIGDVVECKTTIGGNSFGLCSSVCVVVESDETGNPCLWGFATTTETKQNYSKFLNNMNVEFKKSHADVTGNEDEFFNISLVE